MNQILQGLEGVECNISDVLVHGRNREEHEERLETLIKRLVEAGVTLNLDKCKFSTDKIKFLGHVISSRGIEVDPDKLHAVAAPPPQNVQEEIKFLAMVLKRRGTPLQGNQWT